MNFKKITNATFQTIITSALLSGCSVFMAAQQKGVDVNVLAACKTRTCIMNHGATPIQTTKNKSGSIIAETFQAEIPSGSAARAAMHGVLDVATLGIWEVAGTPIEAIKGEKQNYSIKVTYASDENIINSMQLLN